MATPTNENELAEQIVRKALDDALRMYGPQRRSFLGGMMAMVGLGGFARGDGLPHGGTIKPAHPMPRVGEWGAEMVIPAAMAKAMLDSGAARITRMQPDIPGQTFTVQVTL